MGKSTAKENQWNDNRWDACFWTLIYFLHIIVTVFFLFADATLNYQGLFGPSFLGHSTTLQLRKLALPPTSDRRSNCVVVLTPKSSGATIIRWVGIGSISSDQNNTI